MGIKFLIFSLLCAALAVALYQSNQILTLIFGGFALVMLVLFFVLLRQAGREDEPENQDQDENED